MKKPVHDSPELTELHGGDGDDARRQLIAEFTREGIEKTAQVPYLLKDVRRRDEDNAPALPEEARREH